MSNDVPPLARYERPCSYCGAMVEVDPLFPTEARIACAGCMLRNSIGLDD